MCVRPWHRTVQGLTTRPYTLFVSLYGLRHKAVWMHPDSLDAWFLTELIAVQLYDSFDSEGCLIHHMTGSHNAPDADPYTDPYKL